LAGFGVTSKSYIGIHVNSPDKWPSTTYMALHLLLAAAFSRDDSETSSSPVASDSPTNMNTEYMLPK